MPKDQTAIDAALKNLAATKKEPAPDFAWADQLPDAPPMPAPGETVAIVGARKPK